MFLSVTQAKKEGGNNQNQNEAPFTEAEKGIHIFVTVAC